MVAGIYDIMSHILEQYFSGEDELPPDSGVLVKQRYIVDKEESEPLFQDCGIIKKTGFVKKGGGSAYVNKTS